MPYECVFLVFGENEINFSTEIKPYIVLVQRILRHAMQYSLRNENGVCSKDLYGFRNAV